jgi:nitroreductase
MANDHTTERRAWRNAAGTATPPRPSPVVASNDALTPLDPLRSLPPSLVQAITHRPSQVAFSATPVAPAMLRAVFDAMRCAASAYNEQPWRFILSTSERPEAHAKALACFEPANQRWAATAPVLLFSLAKRTFAHNGQPNAHAWHDLGMAVENAITAATALGLLVHQTTGIERAQVIAEYAVPADFDAVAGLALGYRATDPGETAADARSQRQALDGVVFIETWGRPAGLST